MLGEVFNRLPHDAHRNLLAVHDTCKAFRNVVANEAPLQRRHRMERQIAPQMAHLAVLVGKAVDRATKPNRAIQCVPLFPLLEPEQRGKLVDVVIDERNHGGAIDRVGVRARNVGRMAQMLACLDKPHQAKLVEAAIGFCDGTHAAVAISGFGVELAHLDKALRGKLVDKAVGLMKEQDRAAAIAGLSVGLAHLDDAQKESLLTAATTIDDEFWKNRAIQALCKGWKGLKATHQATLFDQVIILPVPSRAQAVQNLGSSLKDLSVHQWAPLVASTLELLDRDRHWAPLAIGGLAAGLERLTLPQRDTLVTESMARLSGEGKAKVITALGAGLAHLTPAQQDKLLDAAAALGISGGKAEAIAGLAAGLASLDKARQDRVVGMALGLPNDYGKARAIAALGARLGDLEHEQHQALVDAAIGLFRTAAVDKETYRALGAGLGAGLGHLHPDLRSAVVHTLTRKLSRGEKRLRPCIAEAIAGLGAGRPHLDDAQYEALVAAATRLQSRAGWAPFRKPDHRVIVAFAAEAAKALGAAAQPHPRG
jgi:hypothetical protein